MTQTQYLGVLITPPSGKFELTVNMACSSWLSLFRLNKRGPLLCLRSSPTKVAYFCGSPSFTLKRHATLQRMFSSEGSSNINTKVNFSLGSDSDEDDDNHNNGKAKGSRIELPPPYNPFHKKPAIGEPEDSNDLQQVFHKMRSEGLLNNAVKMFDALSKDGRTHEALELFAQIKDKGHMPDVVAHTAVIEAYANAGGQSKQAVKVFQRMLASGVPPNAYTYTVLIKGLAADGKLGDASKHLMEMMGKGMRPNAAVYTAVLEAFARENKVEEAKELLDQMKTKGFVPDEKSVRENLCGKRGPVFRTVIDILFGK